MERYNSFPFPGEQSRTRKQWEGRTKIDTIVQEEDGQCAPAETDWFMDGRCPDLPTLTLAGGVCRAPGLSSSHDATSHRSSCRDPYYGALCASSILRDHWSPSDFSEAGPTTRIQYLSILCSHPKTGQSFVEGGPEGKHFLLCLPMMGTR